MVTFDLPVNFTLVSSLQACFFQIEVNWTSLIFFTMIFTWSWPFISWNPVTYRPHCNSQQETAVFKSFSALRQCCKVEQFWTSWRRREEFFCRSFTQSSKLLRMLITFSSRKCRSAGKIPPGGKRPLDSKFRACSIFLTWTQSESPIEISLCYFINFNHPQRD